MTLAGFYEGILAWKITFKTALIEFYSASGFLQYSTYVIFSGASEVLMIERAMKTISFVSCIQFVEWDGIRKDYVHFHPDKTRLG